MGWSLSWAAVRGGSLQTVCEILGLRPTGKREEVAESKIDGVQLPNGWYVVLFNRTEIKDQTLKKLSQANEVVGCFNEDHVMFSSASLWRNGEEVWHVEHDGGEKGALHLVTRGNLPVDFENIRKELFAEQEQEEKQQKRGDDELGVDYVYDLPAELAKKLTGFRHDQDIPGTSGAVFEVLEPASQSASLFSRFLGKKGQQ